MHTPRLASCLLVLAGCSVMGCNQTSMLRSNSLSSTKTVASVGDKTLPIVAGEPGTGTATRAETEQLDLSPASGSNLSGRVLDDQGKPVPNARVRLVVGGAPAGRDNYATTDRAGGFTLRGLRAGRSYTLIAESQGEDGMMSGRAAAKAPQTDVRIQVAVHASTAEPKSMSIRPARSRVEAPLDPDEGTEEGFPLMIKPGAIPADDDGKEPPAEEAASLSPKSNRQSVTRVAATSSAPIKAGWNVTERPASSRPNATRKASDQEDLRPRRPSSDQTGRESDDEVDPLPPALDIEQSGSRQIGDRGEALPLEAGSDQASASRPRTRPRRPAPAELDPADGDSPVGDRASQRDADEPRSIPEDLIQPAGAFTTASYAKGGQGGSQGESTTPARKPQKNRRSTTASAASASRARKTPFATEPESADVTPSSDEVQPESGPQSQRRPTWRDLNLKPDGVPIDESVHRSSAEEPADDRDTVKLARGDDTDDRDPINAAHGNGKDTVAQPKTKPVRIRPSSASIPPVGSSRPIPSTSNESTCDIDPADRRVVDFQLPGLDGNMVSFRDFEADVIVLDFWGSWCVQCRKSIAFEQELLAKLGAKRVKVIGIACEKGATLDERRASAAKACRQLGINYPVLVSSMDGTCPLQKAFQVQFYPTMVVLDREGQILHIEQGATDATLNRTGRTVATALQDADSRVE